MNINKNQINRKLSISVIISSVDSKRNKNLQNLIKDINTQTLLPNEIIIVKNFSPRTLAHNVGVKKSKGDIIVFFDDDVRLGNNLVIENLINTIKEKDVGIVGTSLIPSLNSNFFQKICTFQLLRSKTGIVHQTIESDMVTHAAMAISKSLYWEIGGEQESLKMNDDLYLRYNVLDKGYKVLIVGNTWVYHPQPKNLIELIKKYFRQGIDQSSDYKIRPDLIYESSIKEGDFSKKSNLLKQILRNLKIMIISLFSFKLILLSSRLATGIGFLFGFLGMPKNKEIQLARSVEVVNL